MPRLKTLSVLAGSIAMLALSATTASAEFRSTLTPAQSQGNITVLKESAVTDEGVTAKCPPAEIVGQYHIQKKGQIKQQQTATTEGPHLQIQIKSWGKGCEAELLKSKVPVEIKPCGFQAVQRQTTEATGGVSEACLIKVGGEKPICELQLPVGMETAKASNQGINVGLKEIKLSNNGGNLLSTGVLSGGGRGQLGEKGFVVQIPGHPLCPIKTNENGEISGGEGEAIGVNA